MPLNPNSAQNPVFRDYCARDVTKAVHRARSRLRELLYLTEEPDTLLMECLRRHGWKINPVGCIQQAIEMSAKPNVSVGLVQLPDESMDIALLSEVMGRSACVIRWILLTSKSILERPDFCRTIATHCYDYCTLPVDAERLAVTIGRAYGMHTLRYKAFEESEENVSVLGIVGKSPAITEVKKSILTFARTEAPVLITGETGTGKELAASAIHHLSARQGEAFVPVNCGAIPDSLIQAELFGHEKGAFTGADSRKIGKIESANGGTLFLDEIGELPLLQQVNFLRFLQEMKVQRIGGGMEFSIDARVIAATNVDLEREIRGGRFREDLFYRLNVLVLRIPPLRERREDIEQLGYCAFEKYLHERIHAVRGFSRAALSAMREYPWPGNVRELINRVRRAMIVCDKKLIGVDDMALSDPHTVSETLDQARSRVELEVLLKTLEQTGGNISAAARRLNITRTTLYRLIRKYQLDDEANEWSYPLEISQESKDEKQSKAPRDG